MWDISKSWGWQHWGWIMWWHLLWKVANSGLSVCPLTIRTRKHLDSRQIATVWWLFWSQWTTAEWRIYIGWGDKNSAEALGFTEECCGMSSMLLLALCFSRNAEQKKLARILHELTIEFTQNMIKLFWVQQLCTASCLGRCAGSWEAAAMPRIFSSQLAINFGTFSPSKFQW